MPVEISWRERTWVVLLRTAKLFPLAAILRKYTSLSQPLISRNPRLSKNLPLNQIYFHISSNLQPVLPSISNFTLPLRLVHLSLEHVIVLPVCPNWIRMLHLYSSPLLWEWGSCQTGRAGHREKEEIDGVLLDTMLACSSQNKHNPTDFNDMMPISRLFRHVFY